MPGCAFIFKSICSLLIALLIFSSPQALAQDPPAPTGKTDRPEEDDFKPTPYTSYGDFNSESDEAEDTKFFQYGRFFGLGIGAGFEGATGNKGLLYNGGFPAFELKVLYWFDFNLALVLGLYTSKHYFNGQLFAYQEAAIYRHDLSIFKIGADLRYYITTKDLSAPVTFASPFLAVGAGTYSRTLTNKTSVGEPIEETAVGFNLGAGLEFVINPKKTYFNLEAKVHVVDFEDSQSRVGLSGGTELPNQNGMLFSLMGSFLFTW